MKNVIEKEDNALLIAVLLLGAATVGTLSWLCFTRSGKKFIKRKVKDVTASIMCHQTGLPHQFVRRAVDAIVD